MLDAGCGSGRVTALLADLVPRGRIYAVDVAPSMAAHAREALGDRAIVLCQDLVELDLPEPVDAIFSNATFHWISDHDALFAALHRTLKDGGQLVAQCGGLGNIDSFRNLADDVAGEEPFAPYFVGLEASVELRRRRRNRTATGARRIHGRHLLARAQGGHAR